MFLTRKSPFHFQQYLELTHDVYMQFYCTLVDDWILVEQTYVSLGQGRPPHPSAFPTIRLSVTLRDKSLFNLATLQIWRWTLQPLKWIHVFAHWSLSTLEITVEESIKCKQKHMLCAICFWCKWVNKSWVMLPLTLTQTLSYIPIKPLN